MTHVLLRRQAIRLRLAGKSYNQIKQEIGVSKSTLTDWLRKYPLTKEQIHILRDVSEVRIERYRNTMMRKRKTKLAQYYNEAKQSLLPLNAREIYLTGIFLYWGEGAKTIPNQVDLSNTDPSVLKFTLFWMRSALGIPKEKIRVDLHLYRDMIIQDEINFWSKELNIPKTQFGKPAIKESTRASLDQKGFGHGTCHLRCNITVVKEKIMMAIKAMGDYASEYVPKL